MDYSVLNFGQLLFLLGNEGLQNNIRNIEKINKRIVHLQSGIHFNAIYIGIRWEEPFNKTCSIKNSANFCIDKTFIQFF